MLELDIEKRTLKNNIDTFAPVVSIIISIYNQEPYIEECINSIINQTFKNWELICINDGSTDNSLIVLEKFKNKYKNLILLNEPNCGLSCSRNKGIIRAKGKYILFVDSDDFIRSDTLDLLVSRMEQKNLDMLSFSGVNFIDSVGEKRRFIENDYWRFSRYLPKKFNKDCFCWRDCKNFLHRMAVSSCLTIYRTSFVKNSNIFFPEHVCFEDNLFFTKGITLAKRCAILDEKLYFRRIHSLSITQNWDKHFLDYIKICTMVLKYLESIRIENMVYENFRLCYIKGIQSRYNSFSDFYKKKYNKHLNIFLRTYGYFEGNPDRALFVCGFPIYLHKKTPNKDKVSLFKIEVFKKTVKDNTRRSYLFGIPYYSIKIKGAKITRRILFFRYSYIDKFRMFSIQLEKMILDLQQKNQNELIKLISDKLKNLEKCCKVNSHDL